MKRIFAFALVSIAAGAFAVGGSIAGGSLMGKPGVYIGALVIGSTGVAVAGLIAQKMRLIEPTALTKAVTGGIVGFVFSSALAVWGSQAFNTPVVPVLSVCLVGIGFLVGARTGKARGG